MPKKGLVNSVNQVRTLASNEYQRTVPEVTTESGIEVISAPLLQYPNLMNEFINVLVQKIAYSQLETKMFNNPLRILEGDRIPLGSIGEEMYINPAEGREYDINDFSGLLKKYESDVKVQYNKINLDEQYPVTIIRQELKKAFMSWGALESFIANITTSLYNGAYIHQYNLTKGLVSNSYRSNAVQIEKITAPNTKQLAQDFIVKARQLYLDFQIPSTKYNAWYKVGGYGREIISWSNPEDIVFLIRNDILAYIDVNVLASAFNIDSTKLMGRIIPVDNFDVYNRKHQKIFDGSNIVAQIADKSWFRIKEQDMYMEDFRNANNRSIQYYLNVIKMYQYSYFANAVVFATELPSGVAVQDITLDKTSVTTGDNFIGMTVNPQNTTDEITVSVDSTNSSHVTATIVDKRTLKVVCDSSVTSPVTLTFKAGSFSKQIQLTYQASE